MEQYFQQLSLAVDEKNQQKIIDILKRHPKAGNINAESVTIIKQILVINNEEVFDLCSQLLAELSKLDGNRKLLTDSDLILKLISMLSQGNDTLFNVIRSLGNICYENEQASSQIDQDDLLCIISLLKKAYLAKNVDLLTKISGLLLNLFISNDKLPKVGLDSNLFETIDGILTSYLKDFENCESLFSYLLTILNILIESDISHTAFTQTLCYTIIKIFRISENPEISVACLDILHAESERDEIKQILTNEGICELIFDLIEKYKNLVNDEESRFVLKKACDIIVVILTQDECMNKLFEDGNGKVFKKLMTWLDCNDSDLLSTGILAIGNFARNDKHCVQLVNIGVSKKLIDILRKYNSPESDVKVQHALLSTLKNLVIPTQNKGTILKEGLIDVIYPMISINQPIVVFKMLGTFRMVIEGQEETARTLLVRQDFLKRLVFWCYHADHLGVRGEVPRLITWLIKHCHSMKLLPNLLKVENCVKCVAEMLSANHTLMQNEAFVALTSLHDGLSNQPDSDTDNLNKFEDEVLAADVGKRLHFIINKSGDKMDKQTMENLIMLLEKLIKFDKISADLVKNNVPNTCQKLLSNTNSTEFRQRIDSVVKILS